MSSLCLPAARRAALPATPRLKARPLARCIRQQGQESHRGVAVAAAGSGADETGESWAYKQPAGKDWPLRPGFLYRAPKKESLSDSNGTAGPWTLVYVEFMHWALMGFVIYTSFVLFRQVPVGSALTLRQFLLCAFPLVQALGPGAMTMHEYEGWQLAAFKEPSQGSAPQFLATYNNQWLRQVVYRYLMLMMTLGMMMFNSAVLAAPLYDALCAVTAAVLLFGPKKAMPGMEEPVPQWTPCLMGFHGFVHFYAFALRANPMPASPFALPCAAWGLLPQTLPGWALGAASGLLFLACPAVVLSAFRRSSWAFSGLGHFARLLVVGYLAPAGLVALNWLCSSALRSHMLLFWIPPTLMVFGGIIEAFFSESICDQWMHGAAVFWMLSGYAAMVCLKI